MDTILLSILLQVSKPQPLALKEPIAVVQKTPEPLPDKVAWVYPIFNYVGNTYQRGQCTYFVANKRKVPGDWGNANTWFRRAKAQHWPVGDAPEVGAIGVDEGGRWGHVVYVEAMNPDGTITISEQNYDYNGSIRTAVANPANYKYIY